MPIDSWTAITQLLNNPTLLGLVLVLGVYGGMRGWWVFGREYQHVLTELAASRAEAHRWQDMALNSLTLADRASGDAARVVETAVRTAPPRPRRPRA